jgi:hypothetical protein
LQQAWQHQRDVDEAIRDNDAFRAVHRTSGERVKETLRRGHELLSNKPFGLSQQEASGIQQDAIVMEATMRPVKPLSVLNEKTVLQRLEDAGRPKGWSESTAMRQAGPMTTLERVFQSAPNRLLMEANTFEGRSKVLLPTMEKTMDAQSSMRQFW